MKQIKIRALVMLLILLTLAACSNSSTSVTAPDSINESKSSTVTIEEVADRVVGYYPDTVAFQYVRQDKITDEANQSGFVGQECYLFDVIFDGKKVSGVAVGTEDSSVWILDMNADNLWLSERFMGLPLHDDAEAVKPEPVINLLTRSHLYFARLDTIPELSNRNEGYAEWNESEETLTLSATKNTGTVTGAIDGPHVKAVVFWNNEKPELVSVKFQPAPTFSHPSQVLASGEIMSIETSRLLEIAEYFKALIQEKQNDM